MPTAEAVGSFGRLSCEGKKKNKNKLFVRLLKESDSVALLFLINAVTLRWATTALYITDIDKLSTTVSNYGNKYRIQRGKKNSVLG